MKRIDDEFSFQVRELADQMEGILGDPPDRKNYNNMVTALLAEYGKDVIVEDVNLLSFALVNHLIYKKPASLLTSAKKYEATDPGKVAAMIAGASPEYDALLAKLFESHPALVRKAVVIAFLKEHPGMWLGQEEAPEEEEEEENDDELDEDEGPTDHIADLFDEAQDPHEH